MQHIIIMLQYWILQSYPTLMRNLQTSSQNRLRLSMKTPQSYVFNILIQSMWAATHHYHQL